MKTDTTNISEVDQQHCETVLTVADVAVFLRISESVVRRLIREHRIPYFKIDGRYLLYRPALEEWITALIVKPDLGPRDHPGTIAERIWDNREDTLNNGNPT